MVQVLPTATSFGEKLVDKLSEAGTKIYYGHQQRRAAKMDRAALQSLQDESKSPMEKIALISQLSPQTAAIAVPLYAPLLKQQAKQQETQNLLGQLGFSSGVGQPQMNITSIQQSSPQMMSESGRDMGNPPSEEGVSPGKSRQEGGDRQNYDPRNPKTWSDEEVQRNVGLLGINDPTSQFIGNIAQSEMQRRQEENRVNEKKSEREEKKFQKEREYHTKRLESTFEEVEGLRSAVPKQRSALAFARNAIETGETGALSKNALADHIGGPIGDALRTAKGAQLSAAGKESLLGNISRVSSRGQNQWFEQRLNSVFPKIGQTESANLTLQEMLEGELALDQAKINTYDRIFDEDREKYGYVRENASSRAQKELAKKEKEIANRTFYRVREIEESDHSDRWLQGKVGENVQKGTPLTQKMAQLYLNQYGSVEKAIKMAEKNGYMIPTSEEFDSFSQRPTQFIERQ